MDDSVDNKTIVLRDIKSRCDQFVDKLRAQVDERVDRKLVIEWLQQLSQSASLALAPEDVVTPPSPVLMPPNKQTPNKSTESTNLSNGAESSYTNNNLNTVDSVVSDTEHNSQYIGVVAGVGLIHELNNNQSNPLKPSEPLITETGPFISESEPKSNHCNSFGPESNSVTKNLNDAALMSNQSHKNPSLRASTFPDKASTESPTTAAQPKLQTRLSPKLELEGKKWMVENQVGQKNLVIADTEIYQSVNIYKCEDCVLVVKGKINSITVSFSEKFSIVFENIVSFVEFINCQKIQAKATGVVPTITIDKVDNIELYLNKESLACEIVFSKSSGINVSVPDDKTQDYVEHPIPEQFKTVWTGKGFKTEAIDSPQETTTSSSAQKPTVEESTDLRDDDLFSELSPNSIHASEASGFSSINNPEVNENVETIQNEAPTHTITASETTTPDVARPEMSSIREENTENIENTVSVQTADVNVTQTENEIRADIDNEDIGANESDEDIVDEDADCFVCTKDWGEFICCSKCPRTYHIECHVPELKTIPDTAFTCTVCKMLPEPSKTTVRSRKTGLNDRQQRLAEKVLLNILCHKKSLRFKTEDSDLIPNLITIKKKLEKKEYQNEEEFINDFKLMFSRFNSRENLTKDETNDSNILERYLKKKVRNYMPSFSEALQNNSSINNIDSSGSSKRRRI